MHMYVQIIDLLYYKYIAIGLCRLITYVHA